MCPNEIFANILNKQLINSPKRKRNLLIKFCLGNDDKMFPASWGIRFFRIKEVESFSILLGENIGIKV